MDEVREIVFVIIMGLFVALGIAGSIIFLVGKNVPFKKKYFPSTSTPRINSVKISATQG